MKRRTRKLIYGLRLPIIAAEHRTGWPHRPAIAVANNPPVRREQAGEFRAMLARHHRERRAAVGPAEARMELKLLWNHHLT